MLNRFIFVLSLAFTLTMINPARGDDLIERGQEFDLSPEIIENSPVLRRWLREIPNIFEDIHNQPSFRTRVRFGYSQFPSNRHVGGINLGVEDIFIANTPLTVSGEYYTAIGGDRLSVGGDLHYYLLPKGSYINITPVLGYRYLETNGFNTDGVNVGARLVLSLSPGGAADIFVTQSFVSPGSNEEVGITTISAGYALTENIRLSTDIQWQNSIQKEDSRVGISLEWMP